MGKEDLWTFNRHPIMKEMGYFPVADVHTYKYDHEKACADVFVKILLEGNLYSWEQHTKIHRGIIPDRTASIGGETYHIEVEMGKADRVSEKAERYKAYYRETRNPFRVLFLVTQERDWNLPPHYEIHNLEEFCAPIRTPIHTLNAPSEQNPEII